MDIIKNTSFLKKYKISCVSEHRLIPSQIRRRKSVNTDHLSFLELHAVFVI